MNNQLLHTPEGVRDIYNLECERKLCIQDRLHALIKTFGYHDIQTPTFEFFDIFNKERGSVVSREMFKFIDREGNTLVLRPDITPSIARCAAKYYMDETMPLRFCYMGNTFINNSSYQGRLKETTQLGCECIGDSTPAADGEMIAMIIQCMLAAGLTEFQVELGEVDFFKGMIEEAGIGEELEMKIRDLMEKKNFFGVEEVLTEEGIPEETKNRILKLQELFGSAEKLEEAKALTKNERSLKAIERLETIYQILTAYKLENYVSFELGMLGKYKYYTGIIFKAYTYGTGEMIVTGGRYDSLLKQFGKAAASIGFAINIDQLMIALSRQKLLPEKHAEGVFVLYEESCRAVGIALADGLRKKGITAELVQKDAAVAIAEYESYAKRLHRRELYYITEGNTSVISLI
ncbi:MAG: ATP phosphoribosyltransferase regulatory subunit [Lachnospiraceae bacterium]|nr:ATP phosphoribosyltransferase regulatory subunit [Lachnospiraceae bacterium]